MTDSPVSSERPFVVAIDGPAGSGKSSTAREVARRLGFRHLDSGALYRAITLALLRSGALGEEGGTDPGPEALSDVEIRLEPIEDGFRIRLDGTIPGPELRSDEVTRRAAHVARFPWVRARLLSLQRSAAGFGGLVADGRDMGTVVFPDAPLKVFLTASLEERARRRLLQEGRAADDGAVAEESERIRRRDESDARRPIAPLRRAPDALVVDTSDLEFDAQVRRIVEAAGGVRLR